MKGSIPNSRRTIQTNSHVLQPHKFLSDFQMMMNTIFQREVALDWLLVYMDNIAIHTKLRVGKIEDQYRTQHK